MRTGLLPDLHRAATVDTQARTMSVHPLATVAPLWIDHVALAVRDLAAASDRLVSEHGLASYPATPMASPGIAGRIVPCGSGYLHLLAVEDPGRAARHRLGAAVLAAVEAHRPLMSWAVATDQIGALVRRTGLDAAADQVSAVDGNRLHRRVVGVEPALAGVVPAIVCWDHPAEGHPESQPVDHRVDPLGITCIELAADLRALRSWLGPALHDLPIKIRPGPRGLRCVTVATAAGDLNIKSRDADDPWLRRRAVLGVGIDSYGRPEEPRPSSEARRFSSSSAAVVL